MSSAWIQPVVGRDGKPRAYRVRWHDASYKQKVKTFKLKRDADAFAHDLRDRRYRGTYTDPKRGEITLRDYFEIFMADSPDIGPRTVAKYRLD